MVATQTNRYSTNIPQISCQTGELGTDSHPWEQRQLGEVMEVCSVKRIHQADWRSEGVRFLRARDIVAYSKHEEVREQLFIDQETYDSYSAISGKVQKGDVLVTGVGTIGVPLLIKTNDPLYFKDGNIIWFKNRGELDGNFLREIISSPRIQAYIQESSGLGTVGTFTIEKAKKTPVTMPLEYSEQRRIGDFFSALDSLIAAAERQEALLRQKKQAYLQLMFPREGENEPRVRFAGFSRKWEQRQLEELVSDGIIALKRGHVIPRQTGRYPVYSSSAAKDGLFCTSDSFMFDQELVTWSIDGGGKPFYRPRHRFSVTNVCGYALIRNPQTFTYRFLGLAMDRAWTRAHFDYSSKAHPSVIEKMYVLPIPSLPEQHRIGVFFSTLDSLIACAEKRAASLRALKSAYLQRMFV